MRKITLAHVGAVVLVIVLSAGSPGMSTEAASATSSSFGPSNPAWVAYYNDPTNQATWAAFCQAAGASYLPFVDTKVLEVPACGYTTTDDIDLPAAPEPQSAASPVSPVEPGFQCVELARRYLFVRYEWPALHGNGDHLVQAYGTAHGLTPVTNTPGNVPQVGDVMSFAANPSFNDPDDAGHVAVVSSVTATNASNGDYTITVVGENQDYLSPTDHADYTAGVDTIHVNDWKWSSYAPQYPYIEWLDLTSVLPVPTQPSLQAEGPTTGPPGFFVTIKVSACPKPAAGEKEYGRATLDGWWVTSWPVTYPAPSIVTAFAPILLGAHTFSVTCIAVAATDNNATSGATTQTYPPLKLTVNGSPPPITVAPTPATPHLVYPGPTIQPGRAPSSVTIAPGATVTASGLCPFVVGGFVVFQPDIHPASGYPEQQPEVITGPVSSSGKWGPLRYKVSTLAPAGYTLGLDIACYSANDLYGVQYNGPGASMFYNLK
jgi:hypothetical protein